MKFVEKVAKDVDTAIIDGLVELGATTNQVNIDVLEKGSKGFLGFGVKQARVRITLKSQKKETKGSKKNEKKLTEKKIQGKPSNIEKEAAVKKKKQEPIKQDVKAEPLKEIKTEPPKQKVIKIEPLKQEQIVKTEQPAIQPEVDINTEEIISTKETLKFLQDLLNLMNITAKLESKIEKGKIIININSEQAGLIIGKKGETLEALQYLTYLVANKNNDKFVKIVVDVENYRERREESIRRMAFNMAKKAAKTRKSVSLEPMNAYDRRIVHETLQNDKFVTTESEGKDPHRKVIIRPKYS